MDEKVSNIEVIKNDMSYMKGDLAEIKATLKIVLEKYVHRDEMASRFDRVQTEIDKRLEAVHGRIEKKADIEDMEKINSVITWINRIVITAVIASILGLVLIQK